MVYWRRVGFSVDCVLRSTKLCVPFYIPFTSTNMVEDGKPMVLGGFARIASSSSSGPQKNIIVITGAANCGWRVADEDADAI